MGVVHMYEYGLLYMHYTQRLVYGVLAGVSAIAQSTHTSALRPLWYGRRGLRPRRAARLARSIRARRHLGLLTCTRGVALLAGGRLDADKLVRRPRVAGAHANECLVSATQ